MTGPLLAVRPRNALTLVSLAAGVLACMTALAGDSERAAGFVAAAAIADAFDGRYARRFASDALARTLGAQLDSLADACAFGMTPAICTLATTGATPLVAVAALIYVIAAVARLAFYTATSPASPGFVGVPAPAAALFWATTMMLTSTPGLIALSMLAAAAAMVAPISIPRPTGRGLGLFALWAMTLLVFSLR